MLLQVIQIQKLWVLHLPDFPQRLTGRSTGRCLFEATSSSPRRFGSAG